MTSAQHFDAIVIGSGQAGGPLARSLAGAGWRVALVERQHVGGTCVNEGCTPTKTMVASARAAYLARRGADYGVRNGPVTVDMVKVRQRKRDIVESFRGGSQQKLENTAGVSLLFGEGAFTGPQAVEVRLNTGGAAHLTAEKIFINTGTRASRPRIEGLDEVPTLDNRSIMELDVVPEHLLVLGGGYIGLEFGQMFHRFGSRVTVIQSRDRLLAREDPDVADEVAKILREDGIEIYLDARTTQASRSNGGIQLQLQTPQGERAVTGSHLLAATGRVPNTDRLNLPAAGVKVDRQSFIEVNERLETNVAGIYALGDVKGGPAFTHISYDDFRIIRANLLDSGNAAVSGRLAPYTVFIDPQLGRVGMTEQEAREQGRNIRVAKMPMSRVARALEMDETRGFMKAVVDAETNQILGAAVLGIEGGEVMAVLQMAMMGKVPYTVLRDAIFAHPTLAEALNNLFALVEKS